MGKLKITIHPLFFIFGLYFAFIGKVFSFLVFTFTALIHEIGHAFVSERVGYTLNRIVLMPYGALISGDIEDVSYKDECLISLGGPLINICLALFFVALWWFFPELYPYTDVAVFANVSIALINLIPCYPLDGGRFLLSTLSIITERKKALKIAKSISIFCSVLMFGLFVYSIFYKINITLLFFSLFMFVGAIDKNGKNVYIKTYSKFSVDYLKRPKVIKSVILDGKNKVKKLFDILDGNYYYVIVVVDETGEKQNLEGESLYNLLSSSKIYDTLNDSIKNLETKKD